MRRLWKNLYRKSLGLMCFILLFSVIPAQYLDIFASSPGRAGAGAVENVTDFLVAADQERAAISRILSRQEDEPQMTSASENARWETIHIWTASDLLYLEENCRSDGWSRNKYVVLEDDISLFGSDFKSIPVFDGVFNGQDHTISDVMLGRDDYVTGFFRYVGGEGVIQSLNISGRSEEKDMGIRNGGICGVNYGVIRNCSFSGSLSGREETGAIAAVNEESGLISGCINRGHIDGYYVTGGITGRNHGTISDSRNEGDINNSEAWIRDDDARSIGEDLIKRLSGTGTDGDSALVLYSGIDTGGIVGCSKGCVIRCTNRAEVGYGHAGYNVGGIAGRQSGILSFCANEGKVYGRKDVGGIVGQMEPYLKPEDVQSLDEAVDKLHDLVNHTVEDVDDSTDTIKADVDLLTGYTDAAVDTGNRMVTLADDYVARNVGVLNSALERFSYVMKSMPEVMDSFENAGKNASSMSKDIRRSVSSLNLRSRMSASENQAVDEALDRIEKNLKTLSSDSAQTAELMEKIRQAVEAGDDAEVLRLAMELNEHFGDSMGEISQIVSDLSLIAAIMMPYTSDAIDGVSDNLTKAGKHMEKSISDLREAGRSIRSIVDYLNSQSRLRFYPPDSQWEAEKNNLHASLKGISQTINLLSGHGADAAHGVDSDLKAVNDQLNVVFHILSEGLNDLMHINEADKLLFTDVSDEEIEEIMEGRADGCTNRGEVRGDINTGGIAGSMAIDQEDPEDSAAGGIELGARNKYLLKNIIVNCINEGSVTGKKNGVGGIVGYSAQGIVASCEGYGYVASTEGNYAGGIAGQSLSIIRNSWAMCGIGAVDYAGGIAGEGATIMNCTAMPTWIEEGNRAGSVAGDIAENAEDKADKGIALFPGVSGNRFVGEEVDGIDRVSYEGVAERISYQELLAQSGIPTPFRHLKVTFVVDGQDLGSQEYAYGASLAGIVFPDAPVREGFYVTWPDQSAERMKASHIIEGEYVAIVKTLASEEKLDIYAKCFPDGKSLSADVMDRPLALANGDFVQETVLHAVITDNPSFHSERFLFEEPVIYHVYLDHFPEGGEISGIRLYTPFQDMKVRRYEEGKWKEADAALRGSYVQTEFTGPEGYFVVYPSASLSKRAILLGAAIILLLALLLFFLILRRVFRRIRNKG